MSPFLSWLMWLLAVTFFFFQFMVRALPNVISSSFMNTFGVEAVGFGLFASMYYYPYAALQVPVGVLLDRVGPFRVLRWCILVFTLGIVVSWGVPTFWGACAGRFLIGMGASASFIGTVKIAECVFSDAVYKQVIPVTVALGRGSGIALNQIGPWLKYHLQWSDLMQILLITASGLLAVCWLFLRYPFINNAHSSLDAKAVSPLRTVWTILRMPSIWCVGLYSCALYFPVTLLADAWASSFLVAHGFDHDQGVRATAVMLTGALLGALSAGFWAKKMQSYRKVFILSGVVSTLLSSWIIWATPSHIYVMFFALFLLGFVSLGQCLVFVVSKDLVQVGKGVDMSGCAAGIVNTMTMLGGIFFQPMIGVLLEAHHRQADLTTKAEEILVHHYVYTAADFSFALSMLPAGLVVATLLAWYGIPETYKKKQA